MGLPTSMLPRPYPPPPLLASGMSLGTTILGTPPATGYRQGSPWLYVRKRFADFLHTITLTTEQFNDGNTKQAGVRSCLNRHYYGISNENANSLLIGSWGKDTRIGGSYRPAPDVDILFLLPGHLYHRFAQRIGNRQSALLQEVKDVLSVTYSQTTMRGDGQGVIVPFSTTAVEVAPGFRCTDGSIITCDTNNGGNYKTSTAEAEAFALQISDQRSNSNTRALVRMLKQWQQQHNVPLKSFHFERLAIEFLNQWSHYAHDVFYYDWMIRDFFDFILARANTHIVMPGTSELIWLGDDWLPRARAAHLKAVTACAYEQANYNSQAGADWQDIFGTSIAVTVT
jgi:Second Messenger Oligonucleotide or Dinucleotide Synthetase domain